MATPEEVLEMMKETILSRLFIGGAFGGVSAESLRIMISGYNPADSYYMFLVTAGLYMLAMWWYPIWMREKDQDKKNQDLIRSVA
jgi:hypothetical protein